MLLHKKLTVNHLPTIYFTNISHSAKDLVYKKKADHRPYQSYCGKISNPWYMALS